MMRSLILVAAIAVHGISHAQQPVPPVASTGPTISSWPPGAGINREGGPIVSARATGAAQGTPIYRGRITVIRRNPDQAAATAAVDRAIEEVKAIGGVEVRNVRREPARGLAEPALTPAYTAGQPLPTIPQRGQTVIVWMETAVIDVEAPTRKAIFDWAAKLPPNSPNNIQQAPIPITPTINERLAETDPAWGQATQKALASAERDARMTAEATGGELGRLVAVWTERLAFVSDGFAQVQVTAEYQIARPRR